MIATVTIYFLRFLIILSPIRCRSTIYRFWCSIVPPFRSSSSSFFFFFFILFDNIHFVRDACACCLFLNKKKKYQSSESSLRCDERERALCGVCQQIKSFHRKYVNNRRLNYAIKFVSFINYSLIASERAGVHIPNNVFPGRNIRGECWKYDPVLVLFKYRIAQNTCNHLIIPIFRQIFRARPTTIMRMWVCVCVFAWCALLASS